MEPQTQTCFFLVDERFDPYPYTRDKSAPFLFVVLEETKKISSHVGGPLTKDTPNWLGLRDHQQESEQRFPTTSQPNRITELFQHDCPELEDPQNV